MNCLGLALKKDQSLILFYRISYLYYLLKKKVITISYFISGLVCYRWMPVIRSQRATIEVVVKANSIMINNNAKNSSEAVNDNLMKQFRAFWNNHGKDPLSGRDVILSSFAPQVGNVMFVLCFYSTNFPWFRCRYTVCTLSS